MNGNRLLLAAALMAACTVPQEKLDAMGPEQLIQALTRHRYYQGSLYYSPEYTARIRATYVEKYGQSWSAEHKADIRNGYSRIGMTSDQVLACRGYPDDINRSVGAWGVHEQWVYGYTYLYFEDGVLTSFQD